MEGRQIVLCLILMYMCAASTAVRFPRFLFSKKKTTTEASSRYNPDGVAALLRPVKQSTTTTTEYRYRPKPTGAQNGYGFGSKKVGFKDPIDISYKHDGSYIPGSRHGAVEIPIHREPSTRKPLYSSTKEIHVDGNRGRSHAICSPSSCSGHGRCVALTDSFMCFCEKGFTGVNCEQRFHGDTVDHCITRPCKNGGTCSSLKTTFLCKCPSGFYGNQCEKRLGAAF